MDDVDGAKPPISSAYCGLTSNKMEDLEKEANIKIKEERLKSILSPIEGFVMNIQSLLVWEKAQPSAVLFVCVNVVFWLAVTTNQRIVFIAAVISLLVLCAETFRNRVWPDMQVNPRDETDEGWTPIHARLLSVPDLCEHVASAWQMAEDWYDAFWELRRREPAKFCTYMCCLCLGLATIGFYIPGVIMSYFILISLLLWPAFLYHDVYGQIYAKLQPFLVQFEQSMESLERKEKRQKRRRRHSRNQVDGEDTSNTDSELNEFCPTPGPEVDAALFHAAVVAGSRTPSSSQGTPTYGLLPGFLPRGGSVEFTDDELNVTDNEANRLLVGLNEMPSYQDRTLDPSADELDSHSAANILAGAQRDPTRLQPPTDLYGISTDEDIGDHELDTPESPLDDFTQHAPTARVFRSSDIAAEGSSASLPPAAAQLLSQTVAAVMTEAVNSLAGLGAASAAPKPKQVPTLPVKSIQVTGPTDIPSGLTPSPQSDEDLEFEMLDSSELDSNPTTEEDKSPSADASPGALNAGYTYLSSFFTRR